MVPELAPRENPEVVDAGRVQVPGPVPVDVHPDLDLPDQLHQVGGRLAEGVRLADDPSRGGGDWPSVPR